MRLRRATTQDLEWLLAQTRRGIATYQAFAPPGWTVERVDRAAHRERIGSTIADPDAVVLVAENGGGHVAWRQEDDRAHLLALFVERELWGTGLAARLHARAIETMRERGLTRAKLLTAAGSGRARRFYEREGWSPAGEPVFAETFGLDVVEYRRPLDEPPRG